MPGAPRSAPESAEPARFVDTVAQTHVSRSFAFPLVIVAAALSAGCSMYRGSAKSADPVEIAQRGEWTMVSNFPLVLQKDSNDCGAAALASVLRFWGYSASPESVEAAIGGKNRRLSAGDMADHARKVGLSAFVFFGTMDDVVHELEQGRPIIVGLGKELKTKRVLSHYEVIVGYEPKQKLVLLLDPGQGFQIDTLVGFGREWAYSKGVTIVTFLPEGDTQLAEN
jgi:predicted double-glycine peptidase